LGVKREFSVEFQKMQKSIWIIFAVLFAALGAPNAQAGGIDDAFTISGTGITGSGTITLMTSGSPGVDEITDITGNFTTTNNGGFSGSITGLNSPSSYDPTNPTVDNLTFYDNLFYPSASALSCGDGATGGLLDYCGLDFLVAGGYEVNVFGLGASGGYQVLDGTTSASTIYDSLVPVTLVVTPEPSSAALFSIGLLAMAFAGRKRIVERLQ
jgi:PEP-CTERM motif-containing protein